MNIFEQYASYGLSPIPCNGKICSLNSWKPYQEAIATTELSTWEGNVAIVCGRVSGGLVCIDFDVKNGEHFNPWMELLTLQAPEILSKTAIEKTPSGGYHVIFRTGYLIKNIKLAWKKGNNQATIETRGEGGYFVCAPSENYVLQEGNFSDLKVLSNEETEILINTARSLNENLEEKKEPEKTIEQKTTEIGISPFDDYDLKSNVSDLLLSRGWSIKFERNGVIYYQRPGKKDRGISASWNHVPNRFYVFTTSTEFKNETIYKASAVYSILEHGGNFNEAAKALSSLGYGKKDLKQKEQIKKTKTIDQNDIRLRVHDVYKNGYKKGLTTGWNNLDKYYSIIKGQFTVITGLPSSGKSEFIDAMMINLSVCEDWKFAIFAPENYPIEMHYHKLIEKIVGQPLRGEKCMSLNDVDCAIEFINKHFYFIDATEDEINLEAILKEAKELIDKYKIDALCLDPWNEIELDKPKELSSTEFIGKCLRMSRKFARRNNIHLWIVAHPTKMQKDKDGKYPIPELYDIEGSAHWRNKADNGLCVHRDFEAETTQIIIQKIKYRYTGKMGSINLKYNEQSGRYEEVYDCPNARQDF